jgi:hypothetical protein
MRNDYGIPPWLYDTIDHNNKKYSPGSSDYTTTGLLKPARIYALEKLHREEIDGDISDNFASFFGTSVHDSIEDALQGDPRYIVEERFYRNIEVRGKLYTIGGQIDLYDKETKTLSDHKYTSISKLKFSDMHEYETQLAINRWLLLGWGLEVEKCKINLFIKDWRASERKKDPDYPKIPFVEVDFPLWPNENVENFIRQSVYEKETALQGFHAPCTPEERWARPAKWALMKKGVKRAVKLFDSEEEALAAVPDGKYTVVHRPGEDIRCDNYCDVNQFCDYYINKDRMF